MPLVTGGLLGSAGLLPTGGLTPGAGPTNPIPLAFWSIANLAGVNPWQSGLLQMSTPDPKTIRVGQGYTATFTVQLRDSNRLPVLSSFAGSETLELVIADDDGTALTLLGSSATWLDASAGTIALKLDDSDTAEMASGPRGLSIRATIAGEPVEVYRATLRVEPRATEVY